MTDANAPSPEWLGQLAQRLEERDFYQTRLYQAIAEDYQLQYACGKDLAGQLAELQSRAACAEASPIGWEQNWPPPVDPSGGGGDPGVEVHNDDSEVAQLRRRVQRLQENHLQLHQDKAESVRLVSRLRAAYAEAEADIRSRDAEIDLLKQQLVERDRPDNEAVISAALIPVLDHFGDDALEPPFDSPDSP